MKLLDRLMAFDVDAIRGQDVLYDQEPVRLFKSGFLESFTHITPEAVVIVWMPVVAFFGVRAVKNWPSGVPAVWNVVSFVLGVILLWTFIEYMLHRFVFHYRPRSRTQSQILFLFHGIHHYQPHIKTRLVMPPVVSIALAVFFYGLFWLVLAVVLRAPFLVAPTFAGMLLGYISYDLIHYATHHLPMRGALPKFLKRHHMEHHYRTPGSRFGVTTNLWDRVFDTEPDDHLFLASGRSSRLPHSSQAP